LPAAAVTIHQDEEETHIALPLAQADLYRKEALTRNRNSDPKRSNGETLPSWSQGDSIQQHQSQALRDHESSSWTDKSHAFTLRFNYQTTHRRAQLKLTDLKGQVHTNCYNFLYIGCAREDFATVAIPAGGLTAPFQNSCAFIACRVTVNPLQAWAGLNNPPDPIKRRVWIRVPKAATVVPGQSQFSPGININMIRDPSLLLRERFENQQPVPAIGAQNRDNDLDTERFRRWWTDIYNHALFECEAQLLQDDYVGQGAMNDAAHRLRELNQEEVLQDGTRITHDTDNHYQRVQAIIDELPIETPYGFSVIEVFHNSLTQSLKDQIKADGITLPPTGNMRNVEQLDELSRYVQHTKNAENKIKNISRIANSSSQGRGANRGNVFMGNIMSHDVSRQPRVW
jgi:hypothetical protein